jgi:hypothetical protein
MRGLCADAGDAGLRADRPGAAVVVVAALD